MYKLLFYMLALAPTPAFGETSTCVETSTVLDIEELERLESRCWDAWIDYLWMNNTPSGGDGVFNTWLYTSLAMSASIDLHMFLEEHPDLVWRARWNTPTESFEWAFFGGCFLDMNYGQCPTH